MEQHHHEDKKVGVGRRDGSQPKPNGPPRSSQVVQQEPNAIKKEELNPHMVKALKLFAKNHHELEKVSDPEKGNQRRVLSYDGRSGAPSINVPASTYEKCGGTVPAGPKFVNELVEKELSNYKVEVEQKFKCSLMNNQYLFPRKLSKNRDNSQCDNNGAPGSKTVKSKIITDTSASPVSRPIGKSVEAPMDKKLSRKLTDEISGEEALFVKKATPKDITKHVGGRVGNDIQQQQLRCESINQSNSPQNNRGSVQTKGNQNKYSQSILTSELVDEDGLQGGINRTTDLRGQEKIKTLKFTHGPHIAKEAPVTNNRHRVNPGLTQVSSPANRIAVNTSGPTTAAGIAQSIVQNGKQKQQIQGKTFIDPSSDTSAFFSNTKQAFNKTVLGGSSTPQEPIPPGQRNQAPQFHSNGPSQPGQVNQNSQIAPQTTSIVINKPIVIQFQNKKITFKNHHHHHHHHHHHSGMDSSNVSGNTSAIDSSVVAMTAFPSNRGSTGNTVPHHKPSKSNPITKKGSPAQQLSPRQAAGYTTQTAHQKNSQSINASQLEDKSLVQIPQGNIVPPLTNQQQSFLAQHSMKQHVKMPSNQQKLMVKMKRPPLQQQPAQKQQQQAIKKISEVIGASNQVVQHPTSGVGPPTKGKKNQVNQILQQILSFEPTTSHPTQPPSPKSIEFSTQQEQNRGAALDDSLGGRRFMQQMTSTTNSNNFVHNQNSLGRPRQSENGAISQNAAKLNSIAANFGISKTQDSKKPPQIKDGFPPQSSYMHNDFNLLELMKNHSNENMSILGGRSSDPHHSVVAPTGATIMVNNSSFSSNFRSQYPTGAKLIINHPPQTTTSQSQAKHTRYSTNVPSTGIHSPTGGGLGPSLTMDNTKAPINRPKIPQNIQHNTVHHQRMMTATSTNHQRSQLQGGPIMQQQVYPSSKQTSVKKKKVSIGSAHQSMRNTVQGQHQSAISGQQNLQQQVEHQTNQSSRLMKKNQIQQQQQLVKMALDRQYLVNMKDQLMKAAYHTSFNSPNRLSQHHPAGHQIPLFTASAAAAGGLMQEASLDDRASNVQQKAGKSKQAKKQQAHSLSNSRKMSATRGSTTQQ